MDGTLRAPRTKVAGVLSVRSTLPTFLDGARKLALVLVGSDFQADALWHGEHPCFGARSAPHSHVEIRPPMLPASAPPHFPSTRDTGHERGPVVLDQDRLPGTLSRDRVAPAQYHSHTDAIAVRAAFCNIRHIRDNIGTVWWCV